jgi:Outer membrane protein beta-barrel domain
MRRLVMALMLVTCASSATAQVFEAGVGIGRGCTGSDGSLCTSGSAMWAAHGSVWFDDRLELGVRVAFMPQPDFTYWIPRDDRFNAADDPVARALPRIDVTVSDRSRTLLSAETLYHFLRGHNVRPLFGLGLGVMNDRSADACTPQACERLMPILTAASFQNDGRRVNVSIIAGVSGRIREMVQIRGGMRFHNFGGEEVSTTEVFMTVGYRFGSR